MLSAKRKLREAAAKEYARTYNRLKGRKQRGTISTDEWNHIVAVAEELRAAFQAGEMAESEYCRKLKALGGGKEGEKDTAPGQSTGLGQRLFFAYSVAEIERRGGLKLPEIIYPFSSHPHQYGVSSRR